MQLVGRTLIDAKSKSKIIPLMNLGDSAIVIQKHQPVAVSQPVIAVHTVGITECESTFPSDILPAHLNDLYHRSIEHATTDQASIIKSLLIEFQDIFSKHPYDVGHTDLVQHTINVGDARSIKQAPRRLPPTKRVEVLNEIEKMHKAGLIQSSSSPWCSPLVLVRRKSGGTRICVDYRALN